MLGPFKIADARFRESLQTLREGEIRLGQKMPFPKGETIADVLANTNAKTVILGICEDIGVQGNFGRPGADSAWKPFLKSFLNLQALDGFAAEDILLLGHIDGSIWAEELVWERPRDRHLKARKIVHDKIDPLVREIAKHVFLADKNLLVIGGGHNNAYPLLAGLHQALNRKISVLNIDAHTDLRALEGRHSGNGFRYAWHENMLTKYAVLGLQKPYTAQGIFDFMAALPENFQYHTYRSAVEQPTNTKAELVNFFTQPIDALEIDLDVVADFPSSALGPLGFTFGELYQWLNWTLDHLGTPRYLHLCEAAPSLVPSSENKVGKALAALAYRYGEAEQP